MPTPALFAAVVLIWGTTWYAILYQLPAAAPEVAVALRFALAAAAIAAWCVLRRLPMRFTPAQHGLLALQGALGYCLSYLAVYHAERHVITGLVAVGYAVSPLLNLLLMRLLFGAPGSPRVALGGLLGLLGVVLVFWPQFVAFSSAAAGVGVAGVGAEGAAAASAAAASADSGARSGGSVALGAALTAAAVLLSALAIMVMVALGKRGVRGWPPLAVAMAWSALYSAGIAMVLGRSFEIVWSVPFALSLAYLSLAGSALAFGGYFRLVERVGAARSGYVGVMVPVVALGVSSLLESFQWHLVSMVGVMLAVAGNVITLRQAQR